MNVLDSFQCVFHAIPHNLIVFSIPMSLNTTCALFYCCPSESFFTLCYVNATKIPFGRSQLGHKKVAHLISASKNSAS